jgi:hypothetical protein
MAKLIEENGVKYVVEDNGIKWEYVGVEQPQAPIEEEISPEKILAQLYISQQLLTKQIEDLTKRMEERG